jgi:LCP family protein required for cell wall assembly
MAEHLKQGRRSARRRGPGRWLYLGLALILILFCAGYGISVLTVRASRTLLPGNQVRAPGPLAGLPGLAPASEEPLGRINVLVMGIDRRPGKGNEYLPPTPNGPTDPGRSDSIAVVSIDPVSKSAALLNIPRDLWLEVPDGRGGWSMDRINEPYHTGEINKLPGGGGALAAQAITHNFGIPIDYWVDVDFNGFTALFDALGGIDINVPAELTATVLPRGDTGAYDYTYFPGSQHLSGELALGYARFRLDADGDFGRIRRQQAVVLAAREKALSLGWVDHPLDLWQKYSATVSTNVPVYKVPGLALLARQIQPEGITARSLGDPEAVQEAVIPITGADVLFPVPSVMAKIVGETFGDSSYSAKTLAQLQREYPSAGNPGRPSVQFAGSGSAGSAP